MGRGVVVDCSEINTDQAVLLAVVKWSVRNKVGERQGKGHRQLLDGALLMCWQPNEWIIVIVEGIQY